MGSGQILLFALAGDLLAGGCLIWAGCQCLAGRRRDRQLDDIAADAAVNLDAELADLLRGERP